MFKLIVTGSREWRDELTVRQVLYDLTREQGDIQLLHGNAKGADSIAKTYGFALGWDVIPYPADWSQYGHAAGPLRNKAMIESLPKADLVVAFAQNCAKLEHAGQAPHMSHGTRSAIDIAEALSIPVFIKKG